jgi:hypothetical protein
MHRWDGLGVGVLHWLTLRNEAALKLVDPIYKAFQADVYQKMHKDMQRACGAMQARPGTMLGGNTTWAWLLGWTHAVASVQSTSCQGPLGLWALALCTLDTKWRRGS